MWELLPPPSPQSGARAPPPPPRFRFPRRHLRHGRFRHRLHPGPDTAGQKREAAALRAALGQREAYLSPEEGRSRRCPAEVPGAVQAGGEGTARRVRAAEVPSPKMAAGAGFFPARRWRRRERRSGRVAELARPGEGSGMGPPPPDTAPFTGTPYPATETPAQPC